MLFAKEWFRSRLCDHCDSIFLANSPSRKAGLDAMIRTAFRIDCVESLRRLASLPLVYPVALFDWQFAVKPAEHGRRFDRASSASGIDGLGCFQQVPVDAKVRRRFFRNRPVRANTSTEDRTFQFGFGALERRPSRRSTISEIARYELSPELRRVGSQRRYRYSASAKRSF